MDREAPLRACLEPWLDTFQALHPAEIKLTHRSVVDADDVDASSSRILWMDATKSFDSDNKDRIPLERFCEAVSLLTLLGQADAFEWRQALNEFWPEDKRQSDQQTLTSTKEPVVVGVYIQTLTTTAQLRLIEKHLLSTQRPSASFTNVVTLLAPRVAEEKRRSYLAVPLRMEIYSGTESPKKIAVLLRQVDAVVEAQHTMYMMDRSASGSILASKPHFLVDEVMLDHYEGSESSMFNCEALGVLRSIQKKGVRPPMLLPLHLFSESAVTTLNVTSLLWPLLALDGETPASLGIKVVKAVGSSTFPVVLSGVQHSPSVETVDVQLWDPDGDDEDEAQDLEYWRWIAYSLLSKHATHRIETLQLAAYQLTTRGLEAVREMLASKDPLPKLIKDAKPRLGHLAARTFHVENPLGQKEDEHHGAKKCLIFETPSPVTVPITKKPHKTDPMWWRVWLPGCGHAWVHRKLIVKQIDAHQVQTRSTPPSFARLEIPTMNDESRDNMLELVALIGQETRELAVDSQFDEDMIDDWIGRVLSRCPRLQALEILNNSVLENLQTFVENATGGGASLKRLMVDNVEPKQVQHAEGFFRALQDPNHPLSKSLQEVKLTFHLDGFDLVDLLLDATLAMLEKNQTLHTIHVAFYIGSRFFSVYENMLETPFAKHIQRRQPIRTGPLTLTSKLAFLSAVGGEKTVAAMRSLDSNLLSTIFQFAAESVTRRVTIVKRYPRSRDGASQPEEEPASDEDWESEEVEEPFDHFEEGGQD